jgi:hypothetical protein
MATMPKEATTLDTVLLTADVRAPIMVHRQSQSP